MNLTNTLKKKGRVLIKKCHMCGTLMESEKEHKKCVGCKKSFLPTNYFSKVHAKNSKEFDELFTHCDDIHEDDLIKGINVLW
ncbi:MAG: hypothetical protein NXH75_17690 [Halobacteriovoraceae bacterium]|jgi:hypothetical protein|nr:hypothetical protein [Halobacteriovoraceae bacterium]